MSFVRKALNFFKYLWKTVFKWEAGGNPAKVIGGCGLLERMLRVVALFLETPKTEYTFSWCVFVHPHKTVYAHGCVELGDRPDFGFSFFLTTKGRHLSPVEIGNEGSPGRY